MNNNTKQEDKGTPGVNASQTKGNDPKNNGQVAETTAKPTATNGQLKHKTIEEQIKFFDGLAFLVHVKRKFEAHRVAINDMSLPDEELAKFETEKKYGIKIVLHDDENNDYVINNPKLVKEVQTYLLSVVDAKIAEYDHKITMYGN